MSPTKLRAYVNVKQHDCIFHKDIFLKVNQYFFRAIHYMQSLFNGGNI